ncbi:hypothetical protein SVIO_070720 [Streptomyces violaceusniger]|uniref:Thioredoxin domain-containing protein n=2 Tax=Streptomyces violaceusniger TaxID=68280 RepID=A0A4D4LEU1_STRVO|nr:hypothetical protein SVIO_070720 [Streptomyces violaceusniger]
MPLLAAVVVFVGALCALDLILTLGVIKRLREQTTLLAKMSGPPPAISIGEEIGEFEATTVDGEPVSRELLTGETLVAFFSPTCGPCKEKLPAFVDHVRALPAGGTQALAVVVGEADDAAAFLAELSPVARVVLEGVGGPLGKAFQASAYPTLLRVAPGEDGRVVVTANQVALDRPTAVPA